MECFMCKKEIASNEANCQYIMIGPAYIRKHVVVHAPSPDELKYDLISCVGMLRRYVKESELDLTLIPVNPGDPGYKW